MMIVVLQTNHRQESLAVGIGGLTADSAVAFFLLGPGPGNAEDRPVMGRFTSFAAATAGWYSRGIRKLAGPVGRLPTTAPRAQEQKMKLIDHATGLIIMEFSEDRAEFLTNWCEAHGYLPHHRCAGGWVVIAK